ncbi:MAG: hypothetical protein HQL54_04755 [Magnetococcales bacterium]|nr:hypothetical protein [Magnetococcales bacterium]
MPHHDEDEIQRELREKQKFSMASAIGRSAGGAIKGASPIPRQDQAISALNQWVDQHLKDSSGAMKSILKRRIKASTAIIESHLDTPLSALTEIVQPLLESDPTLHEFVRQVDVKWGQEYQERPHFQQPGQAAHPDDEYTHESVKSALSQLLEQSKDA